LYCEGKELLWEEALLAFVLQFKVFYSLKIFHSFKAHFQSLARYKESRAFPSEGDLCFEALCKLFATGTRWVFPQDDALMINGNRQQIPGV